MIDLSKRNLKNNVGLDLSKSPDTDHHTTIFEIGDKKTVFVDACKQSTVRNKLKNFGRLIINGQLIIL